MARRTQRQGSKWPHARRNHRLRGGEDSTAARCIIQIVLRPPPRWVGLGRVPGGGGAFSQGVEDLRGPTACREEEEEEEVEEEEVEAISGGDLGCVWTRLHVKSRAERKGSQKQMYALSSMTLIYPLYMNTC